MSAQPFGLRRWFAVLGLLVITLVSSLSAWMLSRFLTGHVIRNDGLALMGVVQSVADTQGVRNYFAGERPSDTRFVEFVQHIARLPDVMRTNVYSKDTTLLWSSEHTIEGRKFTGNPQLDGALSGELRIEWGVKRRKEEHVLLATQERFVEIYVPVRDAGETIGVVELYRVPKTLFETVDTGQRLVWTAALGAGVLMFASLYWLVHRADRTIREQQRRLVESETLAVLGEMSAAVAHGIRNPLASIRSSAELTASSQDCAVRESAHDVIAEVDRLERWVRDLLTYSQPESAAPEPVEIRHVIRRVVDEFGREMERRGVRASLDLSSRLPHVQGDTTLYSQVFASVIANGLEAMPAGGELRIAARPVGTRVVVDIEDTGVGMATEQLAKIFKPFYTTKKRGLGVGLSLVRRILGRFGATVDVESELGRGTRVRLELLAAS